MTDDIVTYKILLLRAIYDACDKACPQYETREEGEAFKLWSTLLQLRWVRPWIIFQNSLVQ